MDRRIIQWGLAGLLLTLVAVGASGADKLTGASRDAKNATQSTQPLQTIQWITDLKQAQRLSDRSGRPMLIVFGGPWCEYCKKLDREVLSHPTIVKYINATFIPVHLDAVKDAEAAKILEVESLPTTVILSPDADLLGSMEGYFPLKEFATVLKQSADFHKQLKQEAVILQTAK
jgi:thioredoxin-related protein